jgi:hypothetical protein
VGQGGEEKEEGEEGEDGDHTQRSACVSKLATVSQRYCVLWYLLQGSGQGPRLRQVNPKDDGEPGGNTSPDGTL